MLTDIQQAEKRISSYIQKTPLRKWEYLRRILGHKAPVYLKLETFQNTGSFKVRGAANKIIALKDSGAEFSHAVAASAGNHAQAVAFVASRLGIQSTIVMPEGTPLVKAAATEDYGARVVLHGTVYDEAYAKAQEILSQTSGSAYVHAYADPDVISGQGTIGLEIHRQLLEEGVLENDSLQVVVPIGGGGLMAGVGSALRALRPGVDLQGVVCEAADGMARSLEKGEIVPTPSKRSRTLAEGLAVKSVNPMTFSIIKNLCSRIAVVSDDEVALAIFSLMERGKLVAEGAGAAGVAAALAKKLKLDPNKATVFVVCGGNIDMNMVSNILERALVRDQRWLNFEVTVEDRPGELAKITALIGALRANVLDIYHDRTSGSYPVGSTGIKFRVETRGEKHAQEISSKLKSEGYAVRITNE